MEINNQLKTILFFELNAADRPLHGYELLKRIAAKGIRYSHQQIYRDLNKMNLIVEIEPIVGKPDRKLYQLPKFEEFEIDSKRLSVDVILAYPHKFLINQKLNEIQASIDVIEQNESANAVAVSNYQLAILTAQKHHLTAAL